MDLSASGFFSLAQYAHAALFEGELPVWAALEALAGYLKKYPLGKIEVEIPSSVTLVDRERISIGKGAIVEPGAYIQGPCIIGPGTTVRHGAYIRGHVITGEGCLIGHCSEIKHAIFLNCAAAPHFNYVGDSVIGNEVNLGAGVICANYRLDHECISVNAFGKKIPTKLKKLGAIVGDGTQVGCHCVLSPGTLLGKNVLCHPGLTISGSVASLGKVKPVQKNVVVEK